MNFIQHEFVSNLLAKLNELVGGKRWLSSIIHILRKQSAGCASILCQLIVALSNSRLLLSLEEFSRRDGLCSTGTTSCLTSYPFRNNFCSSQVIVFWRHIFHWSRRIRESVIVFILSSAIWRWARSAATLAIGDVAPREVHLGVCDAWEYCFSLFALRNIFLTRDHLQILELFKSFVGSIVDHIICYIYVETILCFVKRLHILIMILKVVLDGFLEEVANRLIGTLRLRLLLSDLLKLFKTVKLLGRFDLVLPNEVLFRWQLSHLSLERFIIHVSFDVGQFTKILLVDSANFMGWSTRIYIGVSPGWHHGSLGSMIHLISRLFGGRTKTVHFQVLP